MAKNIDVQLVAGTPPLLKAQTSCSAGFCPGSAKINLTKKRFESKHTATDSR